MKMIFLILTFLIHFCKLENPIDKGEHSQDHEESHSDKTPLVIFLFTLILLLCLFCKRLNKLSGIPYSSLILLLGILLSMFKNFGTLGESITVVQNTIGRDELYYIFIPILIFESGFNSNLFMFKRNLKPIFLLAFPGVLLCTFLFGGCLYMVGFGQEIPFSGLLVISAILGSTDPIAVCALLTELGTPHKLNIMLEGESLLNDGVAVVIFQTCLQLYRNIPITAFEICLDTFTLCVGGSLVGYIFGQIFLVWIKKQVNGLNVVCITFINCFMVFFFCEYLRWELSGILAVVVSSIILSHKAKINMIENELYLIIDTVWQFAKFVTESILFVITGVFIGKEFTSVVNSKELQFLLIDVFRIIVFFFIMNICRLLVILIFLPFMNEKTNKHEYKISMKDCVLIAYSGIRGAFPLILTLGIASNPDYDLHFRKTTILITIVVIFLGMIFNGLTLKFLVKKLKIKNQFEYNQNVKNLVEKEMFVENYKKFQQLKAQSKFSVVNWSLVYDLSGLKSKYKNLQSSKKISKTKTHQEERDDEIPFVRNTFLINTNDVLSEFRIRIIYNFKALVYSHLKESFFSSEAAIMLIEICDCALEETENKLTMWYHLEELLVEDFFTKLLFYLKDIEIIYEIIKKNYIIKLCSFYEAVNGFITFLNIIKNNKENERGITSAHFNYILNEINHNIKKAEDFLDKLLKKNSVLLQLYQTKFATREILHNRKKIIKNMKLHGIVREKDIKRYLKINREYGLKVDNFGIKMDKIFIGDIMRSNYLFSLIDAKDIQRIILNQKIIKVSKDQQLFKKKQNSTGIYLILSGSVTEYYSENKKQIKLIGNLLGISSLINNDFLYDTDIICHTRCSFLKLDLYLIQEFINKYKSFENHLYLIFFHHKLNFLENSFRNNYFEKTKENSFNYKNKGEQEILNKGFFLVKGDIRYKFKEEEEYIYSSSWHLEENDDNREIEIIYQNYSVMIIFEESFRRFDSQNELVQNNQKFYSKGQNIENEFNEIEADELY